MNHRITLALLACLTLPCAALAAGHGSGGHGVGGGSFGGRSYGGRFGAYGGGYRGGRAGYRYYGGWGWGGLGYGLFFASLPLYYSTLWSGGIPYYYAYPDYYSWNPAAGQYETVRPPAGLENPIAPQESTAADLYAYPRNGQSTEQQAKDRSECQQWAAEQGGVDPAVAGPTGRITVAPSGQQDFLRAQTACLEGRGYSVR